MTFSLGVRSIFVLLALGALGCSSRTPALPLEDLRDASADASSMDMGGADMGASDLGAPLDAASDAQVDAAMDASSPLDLGSDGARDPLDAGPPPDVDAAGLYVPPDYAACDGNTFFPDGSCADGACAATEIEAHVYAIWKARFMEIHHLDASLFAERIDISDISFDDGPVYVWWRVDYVFHLDWVRMRQSESVNLGEYPWTSTPTDEEVTHAVELAIETAERFDVAEIAQFESVVDAIVACSPYVTLDWCSLDFENVSGNPIIHTRSRSPDSVCKAIQVQLENASTDLCLVDRCSVH